MTAWLDWDGVAREHGLQLIALSRPGYTRATRRQGWRVAEVASDVAALSAEHIPTARTHTISGRGHISLVVRYRGEIAHDSIARSAAAAA